MASRPPRSARPRTSSVPAAPASDTTYHAPELSYPAGAYSQGPQSQSPPPPIASPTPGSYMSYGPKSPSGIQFDPMERGQRDAALDVNRPLHPGRMPSAYTHGQQIMDVEGGANVGRKKSLVRPEREKIEPGHRQWHYRTHAAQAENEGQGRMGVLPSATGNAPIRPGANLRRGKSILAREEDVHESGLNLFHRGPTLRRRRTDVQQIPDTDSIKPPKPKGLLRDIPGPKDAWMYYCWFITCLIPNALLRVCGFRTPEQRRAWREKMGLISIIACLMAMVGYVTFGFTQTVCGRPPDRFHTGAIGGGSVVIHGYDYDFSKFNHPRVGDFEGSSNPLFEGNWGAAGNDISFMFQDVGGACAGLITKGPNSQIGGSGDNPQWYFPCNIHLQKEGGSGAPNQTNYGASTTCHLSNNARNGLRGMTPQGQVFYTWEDVHDRSRNLAVFEQRVLDFDLLKWLDKSQISYPALFDTLTSKNGSFNTRDLSMYFSRTKQIRQAQCLESIITVGFIDTKTVGCVASQVVLVVSLVFIIGVVGIRFGMAVVFAWFFAPRIGNFDGETYQQRMRRMAEIENWTNDIYKPAPSQYRPNASDKPGKKKSFLPSTSRFTPQENYKPGGVDGGRRATVYGGLEPAPKRATLYGGGANKGAKLTPPESPALFRNSRSSTSLTGENVCPFPLGNVVPQPPADFEPFGFPLMHTICLVTAYSESIEGLRTTLDSLATTDYPNSHKLILIIADGLVRGAGNDLTTPEICLGMMKDLITPAEEVEPHSYVAIADGHKRHNMAKVYAGFYEYDDATVERSKQQRVPIVLVAKVGNPREAGDAKPGNRGKRDSQIVLMSFLQKVMFDERMTTFEYEFFNAMWRVSGVSPDRYELTLCVDADTKVFPDSMSRLAACMAQDEEIMGLCGETKIANKAETWVTMIQVFEYYISHHMTKAFESMFGGVTCLPGCFSMYRIKAPKGDSGYWVPILANPDIVEHYSENVVDTLHKKNLLLLGEDRYLTTLMLKTFPRRKNMFCPSAVCKTVVPDTFRVLLSQRRRWINSTVHNLFELLLVRDLCGTFCFSMQFVVGMELGGTLVLPAAISFTLYLIIISIIPGGGNTTIPLVLLAIVLGLPGLLIVITSRKLAYVGWMIVYLFSLPVWNGILPMYSFWHFDDFSWGQTRQVAGEKAAENHGDKDGEFDSSHIVMKRWAEFERERRWKSDSQSRDSTYYDPRSSPKRLSLISSNETFQPPSRGFDSPYDPSPSPPSIPSSGPQRPRHDSAQLLMLPTPLSVQRPLPSSATGYSRSSEDGYSAVPSTAGMMSPTSSQPRMVQSPDRYTQEDPYENVNVRGNARASNSHRPPSHARTYDPQAQAHVFDDPPQVQAPARRAQTQNRQEDRHSRAASVERGRASTAGFTSPSNVNAPLPPVPAPAPAAPDAVRRVPRSKRPTSTTPQGNRYSTQQSPATSPPPPVNRYSNASPSAGAGISRPASTQQFGLPPGAGAPAYGGRNRYTDVN